MKFGAVAEKLNLSFCRIWYMY